MRRLALTLAVMVAVLGGTLRRVEAACSSSPCSFGRGNNGNVVNTIARGQHASTWVPAWSSCLTITGSTSVAAQRIKSGDLFNDIALLSWDTSALPDNAVNITATLTIDPTIVGTANNIIGDWHNWGATCDSSDYTTSVLGGGAGDLATSVPLSAVTSFTVGTDKVITLSNAQANISLTGTTYIRIGGDLLTSPTGVDDTVQFKSNSADSTREALLIVSFDIPTATPTPTFTNTPTATHTFTVTPTSTQTPTPTPTAVRCRDNTQCTQLTPLSICFPTPP